MNRKILYTLFAACIIAACLYACTEPQPKPVAKKQEHSFSIKGSVREMNIQPETVDFPEHEGKAEFMSYCAMCHSLKYITDQPDFSKKIWEAEVHKMVERYKAPIDSITGKKIVDYLVAIKSAN